MEILERSIHDLQDLQQQKIEGIMFRSKAKWALDGERNSKYFYSLEKARYNSKVCNKLIIDDQIISDHESITNAQVNFYTELYQSDTQINFKMENKTNIKVSNSEKIIQQQSLNATLVKQALRDMQNQKTPGKDGIPVDVYKVFWNILEKPYLEMIGSVFEKKLLPESMRLGVLNLIPKNGKDERLLKNLRPITLLNADYKIIEKMISIKMKPALADIINKDQTGFMSDRRISTNIRKVFDVLYYSKQNNIDAVILSCDFQKCFDCVEFTCIRGALKYFDFASLIAEWVDILYTDFMLEIQNNGYFSSRIPITRSIHQGGCCSAEIFLICAEILAIELRENENIQGIPVEEIINLLNQFADDLDLSLLANEECINATLQTFENFRQNSGFTLNYDKTVLYRVGNKNKALPKIYSNFPVKWTDKPICVLGVWVTLNSNEMIKLNYEPLINKTSTILSDWRHRHLSILGKINVINTLVAPLFIYKMTVLPDMPIENKK